jgi:hypothetical protein
MKIENSPFFNGLKIETRIFTIRQKHVMLDSHLAELFEVETKQLNRAIKRNKDRFPDRFMFQLTESEYESLRCQFGTSKISQGRGGRRYLPNVFTEHGVAMLPSILHSETAIHISIQIIDTFIELRNQKSVHQLFDFRLNKLENKQVENNQKFEELFKALESKELKPDKGIFFDGQIFDAYTFIADIVRNAKKSIILIDNYVDDTVLTLFNKRAKNVNVTIYTKRISKQLQLDITKYNAQYSTIEVKVLNDAHDRFLIIDETELYHIGASLKDLGKKWFAFSKMNSKNIELLNRL